jgi:hypothetical protein
MITRGRSNTNQRTVNPIHGAARKQVRNDAKTSRPVHGMAIVRGLGDATGSVTSETGTVMEPQGFRISFDGKGGGAGSMPPPPKNAAMSGLSSLPWWVWVAGAVAIYYAMDGNFDLGL